MNDDPVRLDPQRADADHGIEAPATIVCVDCGGVCHLLSHPRPDDDGSTGFDAGDIVAYRCEDCRDRWDLVLPDQTD